MNSGSAIKSDIKSGAVILAGGSGTRFGGKKQFYDLDGKELWKYPYEIAKELFGNNNICVVGILCPGGESRSESVLIGLKMLDAMTDRVIILEAARPLVTKEQVVLLVEDPYPSSTFVKPLVNTVIYRDATYINRNDMYELLTPQAFHYSKLLAAYESGKYKNTTDETYVMAKEYNIKPHFIETEENLMKVTYPEDIEIINLLYKKRRQEGENLSKNI